MISESLAGSLSNSTSIDFLPLEIGGHEIELYELAVYVGPPDLVDDAVLFVHHDRDPLALYPELAEIGWGATALPAEPGRVLLRLERLR